MKHYPELVREINAGFCAYCHLQLAPGVMQNRRGAIDKVDGPMIHVSLICEESEDGHHHSTRD